MCMAAAYPCETQCSTLHCFPLCPQQVVSHTAQRSDGYAVLEMEVMKYVAYCGGVTVRFRLEQVPGADAGADSIPLSWGLASTKPCPALSAHLAAIPVSTLCSSGSGGTLVPDISGGSSSDKQGQAPVSSGTQGTPLSPACSPTVAVSPDNPARKGLYLMCQYTKVGSSLMVSASLCLQSLVVVQGGGVTASDKVVDHFSASALPVAAAAPEPSVPAGACPTRLKV